MYYFNVYLFFLLIIINIGLV